MRRFGTTALMGVLLATSSTSFAQAQAGNGETPKAATTAAPASGPAAGPAAAPAAAPAAGTKAPPSEEAQAEARSRYKAGLSLYEDGAYEAARVQFERAYELAPSYRILYNVGLVQKQLNEFVGSLKSLERYLVEGGSEVSPDRRAEVEKLVAQLKGIIATASVTVNAPGAEITVDDVIVGKAPLSGPVMLNPGRRKIGAKLAGKLPDAKVIEVASGDKANVELSLGEAVVINQGTDLKPIIAWSVTGGMAVAAGTFALLANSASKDREDLLGRKDVLASDIQSAADKQKTLSVVQDILTVGTVLSAGVAVYFTWFHHNDDAAKKTEKKPVARNPKPQVTPGVGSLTVRF